MIVYLKMKPYLKEFLLGMETSDGEKLYGEEPIHIPPKDRLGLMIDMARRKPYGKIKPMIPSKNNLKSYLRVEIEPNPKIPHDDLRVSISEDKMAQIGKYIYNMFCAVAFDYVRQHLYWQNNTLPNNKPMKSLAYRSFIDDYQLWSAEEDSIRKAVDRDNRTLPFDNASRKSNKKENNWRFRPKNLPFQS